VHIHNIFQGCANLFCAIDDALVLSHFLVQLQLSLHVLRGVGDADLDAARDPSGNDALQEGVRPDRS